MNIMIAGLTAAGKTTHSRLLASDFSLSYYSATEAIARISGIGKIDASDSQFWTSERAAKLHERRKQDETIDRDLDNWLCQTADTVSDGVFDTFGLPWISRSDAIRIWLESSLDSRVMKAVVSHRRDSSMTAEKLVKILNEKDDYIRDDFLRRYEFDMYRDRSVFDLVLDISELIRKPHVLSANRSVRCVQEILRGYMYWRLTGEQQYYAAFQSSAQRYGVSTMVSRNSACGM